MPVILILLMIRYIISKLISDKFKIVRKIYALTASLSKILQYYFLKLSYLSFLLKTK